MLRPLLFIWDVLGLAHWTILEKDMVDEIIFKKKILGVTSRYIIISEKK